MKKRIIAMIISIVMVIGMLPVSVFAAEADNLQNFTKRNTYTNETFDDVQRNDWFYENVKSVYELGLMQGKGGKRFDTESGVTIAETLTIAARLHSIYYTGSDAFAASNPWYQVYVDYCAANGVASVNSETYSQPASRAEFVMILTNALPVEVFAEINKVADNAIPDVNVSDAYGAAVYKMYRAGIMIGNDDIGTFAPSSEIKRSEVAAIVTRMVDVSLRESIQLGNEYTVTFNMNGHGKQIDPQTVVEGYTAEKPTDPNKASYTFKGWYTQKSGGQQFDFDTPITEDITLYAHWELNSGWTGGLGWNDDYVPTYTVTFDANGSGVTNLPVSQTVRYGEYAVVPHEPTRIGYVFAGWYLDKSGILVWDKSTPIYNDTTIYASWYYAGINQDDSEAKYKISDIIVDENEPIVNIEVTTQDECYLRLAVTNDAQTEIIYDENVSVHSDLWYEKISINVANLPEYFYIHAFLVDSNGNELCDNYTSVLYSRYFAEFYEKDVDDFDSNLVLNFDNNNETNFSVAQNDVVIYELLSSQVVKNEKKITITGANIPTFVVGQKYVIYDGESIYLCKPTLVDQNGTETTILTDELPLTDYLSYIKIEEVSYAYDTSSSSEQISTFARIDIIDIPGGDNKQTISAGFTVGNDEDDAEIELKADGYIKNTFRLYLAADVSWQGIKPIFYLKEEVEIDLSVNLSARGTVLSSASGEKSKIKTTEELAEINIPIGGIVQPILKLYVPIEANLNAKFDIGFGIKATYGVEYSFENGGRIIDDLNKSFDDQSKVEGEFDLRVGFKASIGVEVLKIVEIKLGGEAGFKTIISIDAESHLGENVVSKHMCALCLEGVLDFYVKASIDVDVDIEIFGVDLITGNLIHYAPLEYTFTLGACYFSLINSSNSVHKGDVTFGWGNCPNIAWKTTFIAKNSSDTTTNDLVNVYNNRSDDVSFVCSGNSIFSEFLYNGSYVAKSTIDGTEYTKTFRVDDAPQTITIKASNGGSSTDPDQPGDDDPVIPPVGTGYTVSGRLVSAADGIGIADMSVSLVNNSNFYTATTDGKGYFKFSNVAAAPVYAFESGDGTTYEYYIDTDVVVSGDIDLGTIQLTPANAPSKTIRIHFVDSDSGEILKISDIFDDKSYIGINHNGLAEGEQYISGDFIDGSKGNNAFTVSDDRELVFTNVPVFGDDIWGNYYLNFDSGEKSHAIPVRYIIATLDLIENSSGEWEVEVELDRLTLIVGDVTVTAENANDILGDGTAKYEYSGNKLTFTNANITADTVIYTNMANLNIIIPSDTVTYLSNNNTDNTSVIYSESGFVYINNGNAEGNGTLYISGCKETITNGSSVYDEYTQFCIRADEVSISSTDIVFADAWGAIRSEDGDINIYYSDVSEKTPYSVKAYLFNSAHNIYITGSMVTDSSDSGATIFAHDDITMVSSTVELTGSNCLLSYAGEICFANNTYAHIISIDTVSEMDYDLIEAALGIRMVSFISSDPADIVKIITPTDGVIRLTTDEVYVIRNNDGSRTNEILIKCPD